MVETHIYDKLFSYQKEVVDKFLKVESSLIGDSMGLGKSIEALALDVKKRETYQNWTKKGTLIITPNGVINSWVRHIMEYTNGTHVVINRRDREPFIMAALCNEYDYYICHWDALRLMPDLADKKWFHIIGDEIHKIQERKTKTSVALKKIPTHFKTGLSGTPAYDKPDDLWSVLNWLYPKQWSSYWKYFDRYVLWVNYKGYKEVIGVANQDELQERINGAVLARIPHAGHIPQWERPDVVNRAMIEFLR